jgi:hypothetical protein
LRKYLSKYPEIVKKLAEDLYVDDTTTGCNSVDEGKKFQSVAVEVMKEAGFDLRKWLTNDSELQKFFDRGREVTKTIGDDVTFAKSQVRTGTDGNHKVLGIEWDRDSDVFYLTLKILLRDPKIVY